MMSNLKLLLNVTVLVFQYLCFFYQSLRLNFVLFLIYLLIYSILLQCEYLQSGTKQIQFVFLHLSLLFKL